MQIHPEIYFPQVKNIELIAKQIVKGYIIGKHRSPYHGFAVEFAEHRQYNHGDPLRHLDWKLYAKTGKLYSKKFEQETNLHSNICIDLSSSMTFSQNEQAFTKLSYALISAATFTYILKKQIDTTALTLFDDTIRDYIPSKSNHRHYQNIYNKLENYLNYSSQNQKTQLSVLLDFVSQNSRKNGLIILFTDFLSDENIIQTLNTQLKLLKHLKHEILIFHLIDSKSEIELDYENRPYKFVDIESGESLTANPAEIREQYKKAKLDEIEALRSTFINHQIDYHPVDIRDSFVQVLQPFFAHRK